MGDRKAFNDIEAPLRRSLQNSSNCRGLPAPLARLALQLLSSRFRQPVVFRAPVVLRGAPIAFEQPIALQPAEGGKQGARVHLKDAPADLLDAQGDSVPVHRLEASVFRMSMSSVPCTSVVGFSAKGLLLLMI